MRVEEIVCGFYGEICLVLEFSIPVLPAKKTNPEIGDWWIVLTPQYFLSSKFMKSSFSVAEPANIEVKNPKCFSSLLIFEKYWPKKVVICRWKVMYKCAERQKLLWAQTKGWELWNTPFSEDFGKVEFIIKVDLVAGRPSYSTNLMTGSPGLLLHREKRPPRRLRVSAGPHKYYLRTRQPPSNLPCWITLQKRTSCSCSEMENT